MKFYKQTKLVSTHKNDNCFPTVLACLFDLRLEDVPSIENLYFTPEDDIIIEKQARFKYLNTDFILNNGEDIAKRYYNEYIHKAGSLWSTLFSIWVESLGYTIQYLYPHTETVLPQYDIDLWVEQHPDTLYTASGNSSRGCSHIVIYKDGKLYHDPHPSDEGLVEGTIYEYKYFEKIF